jgi:tetrahydromethanopterin S-methyltransferase subunit G
MGLFSKKPKSSIDPAEFLSLRSELADLRDRLEASEHAKAITEARLAALDATTTAMSAERPSGEDLRTRVSELEEQLNVVAEHAAAAQTNADNAEAKATAAVAANAAGTPADAPATEPHPELLARVEALAEQINAISNAPDPSIAARLDELASKVEAGPGPDPGLLARLDQLSSRLDSTPDGGRLSEMEARLGELAARAAEPVAGTASGPDPDTAARLDQLAERVASVDSITSQLAQLNARVSAQAEFGTQLSSLRDRISQLHDETEERRAAAVAATDDADLRDRVNAIADRIAATEGLATQIAQLAERVAATDTTTRQATERVAVVEQRLNAVSTELANQVGELGRDIDGLAAHSNELAKSSVADDVIDDLKSAQVKLAAEQARYEIAFREDLAALAEQVRRGPTG